MKNNLQEIFITVSLVTLAVLLLNPFEFWMPDMMVVGVLVAVLLLFGVYASFILREHVHDEREAMHQRLAGRNAYLAGASVLMLGILAQGYQHAVDPWLVIGLVVMILSKIATRMWSDTHL